MNEPVLVVMAAGMGSRYGGLKQIDPIGKNGEIMLDFSLYDGKRAGFNKVIFIINRSIEKDFKVTVGRRISEHIEVEYVYQDLNDLPEGYKVPQGRIKPWGTGHAILACRHIIDKPFAVINADDYYGRGVFKKIYDFLSEERDQHRHAMVGYILENTLTDNGHVARGVCEIDEYGYLLSIIERTRIERRDGEIKYTENGENWIAIPENTIVSMNLWGFMPSILKELEVNFPSFLDEAFIKNPIGAEYFLPTVVDTLSMEKKAAVKVLKSNDRWYGVTYREDKPMVMEAIAKMQEEGLYPETLWKD